jgi:radical SAM protein with 4Fe4S-binding SPASM domain
MEIQALPLWNKMQGNRALFGFDLEITARCNNNCRHCYINFPAGDWAIKSKELSVDEIDSIADEAVGLGALWCLITGGEPLLRDDFFDIYLRLKKKGLLVSVFTNANLITGEHVRLFKKYPPRDIEVSVYGVTQETYEQVTRRPGSFAAFMRGLNMLFESGVKIRLKTMALRSNFYEMGAIRQFCLVRTKDYFRFDPQLHLRFDGNPVRNGEIKSERLSSEEFVALEYSDPERFESIQKKCDKLSTKKSSHSNCNHLFRCGAGNGTCNVSYDGFFRLCPSLFHPDCLYDLRKGSLADAWHNFVPHVRDMRSDRQEFLDKCHVCPLINLCMWCPAHAHLETGEMDVPVGYFCEIAHARSEMLSPKGLSRRSSV